MDGLSFAASVAGIVSLALDVTQILRNYYSDVESAPKDIEDLTQEVDAISKVLTQLETFLDTVGEKGNSFDLTASVLASTIKDCRVTLEHLKDSLTMKISQGFRKVIGRLMWPFRKDEVQKIVESLRRCNQIFQFSLTVEGCGVLMQTSEDVNTILQVQLDASRKLYNIMKDVSTLSEPSKAYLHTAENLAEILNSVRLLPDASRELTSISAGMKELRLHAEEDKEVQILEWLSRGQSNERHHDVRTKRTPGTGNWLLELPAYRMWVCDPSAQNVLWCVGLPGTGKTTQMSLVVDELLSTLRGPGVGIAYFYCDYRGQESQKISLITANILRQLLAQQTELPSSLRTLFERCRRDGFSATASELHKILRDVCVGFGKCFILIDAIDEFNVNDANQIRDLLRNLADLASTGVKVFITSRAAPSLQSLVQNVLMINIIAHESDIKAYISQVLKEDTNILEIVDDQLRMEIIDKIASQAHGMFLLPVLQIRTILGQVTKSDIRKALDVLPGDISEAYDKAFQTIAGLPGGQRDLAMKSLLWITFAKRHLSILELRYALGTQILNPCLDGDSIPTSKSILESCSGLVTIEADSSEVRLVHYTLQYYIRNQHQSLFSHAESFIAQTCLTYLLLDLEAEVHGVLGKSPLFTYAIEHWGNHARNAPAKDIGDLALRLLTDTSRLQKLYEPDQKVTGLHIASGFGLTDLSVTLIQKGLSVNSKDDQDDTPLHKASAYGRLETARMLLGNGANIDERNTAFATPLFLATSADDLKMVDLLLHYGAAIDGAGVDDWTTLHKAADCGFYAIVSLLLRCGASIEAKSKRGLTALHRAAGRGYADIVKLLLDYGANIDAITLDGWSPLQGASSSGQDRTVKLLLEGGADINLRSSDGRTALHRACRGGYVATVEILLEYGADVMAKDSSEYLPLHRAARGGHSDVIELLLQQHPEQLLAVHKLGRTARKEAHVNGFLKTELRLKEIEFLTLGIPFQEQTDFERAINRKDEETVAMLLSNKADVEQPNSNGLKPLHQAIVMDSHNIASLLLQHGADVNAKTTTDEWSPLHYAALNGNYVTAQICVSHGAIINARTKDGYTALHKACQSGNIETVELLLDNGADIEARDDWGWRPIHKSASNGHEVVLKTLLERGANIIARTRDGQSVQACAARGGHHALMEFIREKRGPSGNDDENWVLDNRSGRKVLGNPFFDPQVETR